MESILMEMQELVTSKEISKKLDEAGFKLETPFWWTYEWDINNHKTGEKVVSLDWEIKQSEVEEYKLFPAYTFQQLWEVLCGIDTAKNGLWWELIDEVNIHLKKDKEGLIRGFYGDGSLSDIATQAVLWCIENGYIKIGKEEVCQHQGEQEYEEQAEAEAIGNAVSAGSK